MVFAAYTSGGGANATTSAYSSISPYFSGSYITGQGPPITYMYWPHRLVIDLEDGTVIGKDEGENMLSDAQIMGFVNQANSD